MTFLGLLLFVCLASGCAWLAESLVPNTVPGGFLTSACIGIVGAWLGTSIFGLLGPIVAGVPLVSAIFGSMLFVFALTLAVRAAQQELISKT